MAAFCFISISLYPSKDSPLPCFISFIHGIKNRVQSEQLIDTIWKLSDDTQICQQETVCNENRGNRMEEMRISVVHGDSKTRSIPCPLRVNIKVSRVNAYMSILY